MKKYILNISLIVTISLLFSQSLDLFTQRITLENSLRDKIYSEVGRVINKNKFVVVVNLELGRYGDVLSENKTSDERIYNSRRSDEYLPGVPLSGARGSSSNNRGESYSAIGANDYVISEIDIALYIEQSLATGANEKTIESLIKNIIPQTSKCDDCITIETMNFQANSGDDSEVGKLKKELEKLKEAERNRELIALNLKLDDLQAQLDDSDDWEDYQRRQDSLKLNQFEQDKITEDNLIKDQLVLAQSKLDTVINKRIESETQTKNDLLDIIGGKSKRDDDFLGMQVPRSSSSNTMVILGIILIIIIVIALLIFNKKQVVYLKPKGQEESNSSDNATKEQETSSTQASNSDDLAASPSTDIAGKSPGGTSASLDDSVVMSELKALRQSSISLSASQKEGATQIVKDWLSDGSPKDNDDSAESSEEGGE